MNDLYELNLGGLGSPLRVFDGAGSVVFDADFAAMPVYMQGFTSVPPSIAPWNPGSSFVSDVPHNHPSGKSCLTAVKCYGRNYITAQYQYRGPFVRVYDINSHAGDFMTVASTFIRFGNMSYDQYPYFNNTTFFYFAMFDVTTDG